MSVRVADRSFLCGIVLALAGAAHATGSSSDVDVITTVTPALAAVTYGTTALPTYASYTVTLAHYASRNELVKPVTFTASTAVVDVSNVAVPGQTAAILPTGLPAGCTIAPTQTTLTCTFPNGLYYKTDKITFQVTVKAPGAGHHVNFSSQTSWIECESYRRDTEYGPPSTVAVALNAPDPLKVSTYVPAGGGIVYTGTNAGIPAATTSNTWTATVVLPTSAAATSASILNKIADPTCPRSPSLLDCSVSTLTIPGTFANLVITLRRDASTIARRANIASAIVYYDSPGDHAAPGIVYDNFAFHVPACTDTTYGTLPRSGIPCIQARNAVYVPRTAKDSDADCDDRDKSKKLAYWEFVILAVDNGRYIN